jgi:hypothetical protein
VESIAYREQVEFTIQDEDYTWIKKQKNI